ncbi:MAG: RNA polymerase subunit sigma [Clostridiales bacterium]|nr:RNA polymerase subunit sigma [Clostridiales bacterium]
MERSQNWDEILKAREGNDLARQNMIRKSRPYILNVVSHICKRFVSWSDDEASIGLLAFNHAIDSFEVGRGRSFFSYAYCLINRDLINYFRKNQNKRKEVSLECHSGTTEAEGVLVTREEIEISLREYKERVESEELAAEISELSCVLEEYGTGFEELEAASPRHRDTRRLIAGMVEAFIGDKELIDDFINKKKLPAAAFSKKKGYSLKTIEKHRKYLIAIILIRIHPEWVHLSGYARLD